MKPNILLIMTDQMRADCTGFSGNRIVETPWLDHLSRHGVQFLNAYSAVPSCIAARAALMTGMSQQRHGRNGYQDGVPWRYPHTLAGELTLHGYHTHCVGKMHVYPNRHLCGFQSIELHDGYLFNKRASEPFGTHWEQCDDYLPWLRERCGSRAEIDGTGLDANSWVTRPWHLDEAVHPTTWVGDQTIDFLRRRDPERPFFLMASFVRPHAPLDPPEPYASMYDPDKIPLPMIGDWVDSFPGMDDFPDVNCLSGSVPDKQLRKAWAAYYGLITQIDHQVGRMVRALHEYNELDNTIILFLSDHGEMLGEHRQFRKTLPYRGSAGIPFLFTDFGNVTGLRKGTASKAVCELRDVMPTLLSLADCPIPENVDGCNLLPVMRGELERVRETLQGEHEYGTRSNKWVVGETDKYVVYPQAGLEQYFRLDEDPGECVNRMADPQWQERIAALRERVPGHVGFDCNSTS